MQNIHDTHYKELFSNPLFVQQLCEGFLPNAIHESLDFSTLKTGLATILPPHEGALSGCGVGSGLSPWARSRAALSVFVAGVSKRA